MESAHDIASAERLIFPGVGSFQTARDAIQNGDYANALTDYIQVGLALRKLAIVIKLDWMSKRKSGVCLKGILLILSSHGLGSNFMFARLPCRPHC